MTRTRLETELAAVAVLAEPIRRRLYLHVLERGEASREQAARGLGMSRALAAFHLDKLVEHGLLDVRYRRLTGRTGRGAGRPAKLYRRSTRELHVALPERHYELLARVLARAVGAGAGWQGPVAARRAARRFGAALGAAVRERLSGRPSRVRLLRQAEVVLCDYGFAPTPQDGGLRLRNCPFDAVARDHRALVCGANLCLMEGLVAGLGVHGLKAMPDPQPGQCCVALRSGRKGGGGYLA